MRHSPQLLEIIQYFHSMLCSIRSYRSFKPKKLAQKPVFTRFDAANMRNKVEGEFVGE